MTAKTALLVSLAALLTLAGIFGLQRHHAEAANIVGVTGCNSSIVAVAATCDFTLTYLDDGVPTSGVQAAATGGTLTSVATTCMAATIAGNGSGQIFQASDGTAATNCDAGTTQDQYTWTIRYTCATAGNNTVTVSAPSIAGGINVGSISPGVPTGGSGVIAIQCVPSLPGGASTISIRKIDQFGQPRLASFSIQQGPFWVEVARVNLDASVVQNPCATDGTQGSFNIPFGGGSCATFGAVTPGLFANGLPAGQYRVVEVAAPSSNCTLVQVYNGNQAANQQLTLPYSGAMLTQPVTVNLPSANVLDLQLTFVNSCVVAGAPSATSSYIAVVIGGNTPGIINTDTVEIRPAPGSDDDARVDILIRDANSIGIPNARVTVLIDNGTLALRRDVSTFPNSGYTPIAGSFGSREGDGDTCDQSTNGWLTQSASTGSYSWPFPTNSRQQADGYTSGDGVISACIYVDPLLAPGTTPGKVNIQVIVEAPHSGGLYNGSSYYNSTFTNNLFWPNYLGVSNIVLTTSITVVGPPAYVTVAAAPTTLTCGEKAGVAIGVFDSAGQRVSDRTRVDIVTNFGGVIGGTGATLGPASVAGGNVYPVSSSSAETFNGGATAFLITSTDHVGPYEIVASAGGSVMASNGALAPWYNVVTGSNRSSGLPADINPSNQTYLPFYNQGLLSYTPSSAPITGQATVTCTLPGAPSGAAPAVTAPRTGQGPADAFAIRPPNTGDGGLATLKGLWR